MLLLIDFGATHIKYGTPFKFIGEMKAPEGATFPLTELRKSFESIMDGIGFKPDGIFLSTQMHGFYVENDENYTTWKCEEGDVFSIPRETGLFVKKGLPVFNVGHRKGKFRTLADALMTESENVIHDTVMCGTGFYDVLNKNTKHDHLEFQRVVSGPPVVAGKWRDIPVYTALGDFQTAIASVSPGPNDIIINLGTGSQIAKLSSQFNDQCENRCYFDDRFINCVTHIPSGRALDVFMKLFNIHFDEFDSICVDDIEMSNVIFDLCVFESAYGYTNGGSAKNIHEHTTRRNIISSLLRCYLNQYITISEKFKPFNKVWLVGGIPRRLPVIKKYLEKHIGVPFETCEHDTIHGLSRIIKDYNLM